jgi:eukaryotic-like serine/threonine-protein kinase
MEGLRLGDPLRVGPYRLLKRLGSGGMGQVYLGRSPSGRPVAVKVIRAEHADNADFRQRFRHEVQAARRVSGIFTAAVVDADPDAPRPWMVTVFVSGPSLAAAVTSRGALSVRTVRILAAGLAEGLSEVHAAGLVHRDLKPSNVLLASDGPRIIDFGISRPADSAHPTRTGGVIGSPGFMSPEQAMGDAVGPASDIFCLGSVLAYAATGEPPFGAGPPSALLYRVVYGEASTVNIPPELRPLIANCLIRDPEARPTTDELLAELGDTPPTAGWLEWQDSAAAPAGRWLRAVLSETWPGAARAAGALRDDLLPPPKEIAVDAVVRRLHAVPLQADLPEDRVAAGPAADDGLADAAADAVVRGLHALPLPADLPANPVLAGAPADDGLADAAADATVRRLHAVPLPADLLANPVLAGAPADAGLAGEAADASLTSTAREAGLADVAGYRAEPTRLVARRPAKAGPRHRRPEPRGKRVARAAAGVAAVVVAGALAVSVVSRLEPSQPGAGQAAAEGPGPFGYTGRQHLPVPGHSQGPQATGTAAAVLPTNGTSAPSGPGWSAPTASGEAEPTTVVLHYFAAIDQGNWAAAWALGGNNLYPNRAALVAGYADETGQNVTVVSASGDTVVARVHTTNSWGSPAVDTQQFVVQRGVIVARGPAGIRY